MTTAQSETSKRRNVKTSKQNRDRKGAASQSAIDAIQRHWQLKSFRPLQREALECHLLGRDSLVVMPTGAGKSLCYQAPPVLFESTTVVITPLIALMTDQVVALARREIPAACLNSTQYEWDQVAIGRRFVAGDLRLLYVAPERFVSPKMLAMILQTKRLTSIVVDEAHCISQWGHDFRPDYAKLGPAIAAIREQRPAISVHAYTATATPQVRDEIVESLQLQGVVRSQGSGIRAATVRERAQSPPIPNPQSPIVLVGDFDRPNLFLGVIKRTALDDQLLAFVRIRAGDSGIIYCPRRAETERIARLLTEASIEAVAYHAGLDAVTRRTAQDGFMAGIYDVMVATIAFGMGIDMPDVRYVLHTMIPSSLEVYHQEIGRAGRDGNPAECIIFGGPGDCTSWRGLFVDTVTEDQYEGRLKSLDRAECYVTGGALESLSYLDEYVVPGLRRHVWANACRHHRLMLHFGQCPAQPPVPCGACDLCVPRTAGFQPAASSDPSTARRLAPVPEES